MASEFMTEKRVAEILHVSTMTMWRWRKQGVAPPYMRIGRKILYKFDDVLEWGDKQMHYGPADSDPAPQPLPARQARQARYERRSA